MELQDDAVVPDGQMYRYSTATGRGDQTEMLQRQETLQIHDSRDSQEDLTVSRDSVDRRQLDGDLDSGDEEDIEEVEESVSGTFRCAIQHG